MNIIGIDPGPERSGFVFASWDKVSLPVILHVDGSMLNTEVAARINISQVHVVCCETMNHIRASIGQETFETCYWIGEFRAVTQLLHFRVWIPIEARAVKHHLIGSNSGKPALVAKELRKRWAYGETDERAAKKIVMGTPTKPGPLFGVNDHAWMALAVLMTYIGHTTQKEKENVVTSGKEAGRLVEEAEGTRGR